MASQISDELKLLFISMYTGFIIVCCYDIIRIFRRIHYASIIRSMLEDIIFWSIAAIGLFRMFLKYNYGIPGYFSVGMIALTMLTYEWFIGRHFVEKSSHIVKGIITFFLKPLKKILNGFKLVLRKKFRRISQFIYLRKRRRYDISLRIGSSKKKTSPDSEGKHAESACHEKASYDSRTKD